MKRFVCILMAVAVVAAIQAKKVKVTIDGTVLPSQTQLYLIVNEDTANAQLIPIVDAKFSVSIKVDDNAFIRLQDNKEWQERSAFVLIPDSKHITINWNTREITGSNHSQELQDVCKTIRSFDPGTFHIDVFSDDPELLKREREREREIRETMSQHQIVFVREQLYDNPNDFVRVWLVYRYPQFAAPYIVDLIKEKNPQWVNHPLLKKKK